MKTAYVWKSFSVELEEVPYEKATDAFLWIVYPNGKAMQTKIKTKWHEYFFSREAAINARRESLRRDVEMASRAAEKAQAKLMTFDQLFPVVK